MVSTCSGQRLKQTCGTHAGTDAHGDHGILLLLAAQCMNRLGSEYAAGRAEWMPERNGTTERVDSLWIQPDFTDHRQ